MEMAAERNSSARPQAKASRLLAYNFFFCGSTTTFVFVAAELIAAASVGSTGAMKR
jgi:hypothetical protein